MCISSECIPAYRHYDSNYIQTFNNIHLQMYILYIFLIVQTTIDYVICLNIRMTFLGKNYWIYSTMNYNLGILIFNNIYLKYIHMDF